MIKVVQYMIMPQALAWDLYGDIITVAVLSGKAKKAKV